MAFFPEGGGTHESQKDPCDEDFHVASGQGDFNVNNNYETGEGEQVEEDHFIGGRDTQEEISNEYEDNQMVDEQGGHMMEEEGQPEDEGFCMADADGQVTEPDNHLTEKGDQVTKVGCGTSQGSQVKEVTGHMSRQEIEASLAQILEDVRVKRENDLKIVSEVKAEIMSQAEKACTALDQHMYTLHTRRTQEMSDQVAGLEQLLEKIRQGETELAVTKDTLRGLCEPLLYSL